MNECHTSGERATPGPSRPSWRRSYGPVATLQCSPPPKPDVRLRSPGDSPLAVSVDLDQEGSLGTAQGAKVRLSRGMDALKLVYKPPVVRNRAKGGEATSTEGGELRSR